MSTLHVLEDPEYWWREVAWKFPMTFPQDPDPVLSMIIERLRAYTQGDNLGPLGGLLGTTGAQ